MTTPSKARVVSLGTYLPHTILSNSDLEKMVNTSDEWIVSRSGIRERRQAAQDEFPSTMGTKAALQALEKARLEPSAIDLIIVATMTPDFLSSSTAALIQDAIGASKAAAFDIQAACSGFLYALSVAKAFAEAGIYQHILVVAAEKMTSFIDYTDRNTCILFGDGAAAAVVTRYGAGLTIGSLCLGASGGLAGLLNIPAGGSRMPTTSETVASGKHFVKMQGKELFKHAVKTMTTAAKDCLSHAALNEADIAWLVPHQANERIIDAVAKNFSIPANKVFKTLHKYGNTSASAVAIALSELQQQEDLQDGDHILSIAFGAGVTWGALLLTHTKEQRDE